VPLRLHDVSYTYGSGTSYEVRALQGVDLDVSPGSLVLVLGATGSGKSTLLQIAAGLLESQSGTAEIDGAALTRHTARGVVGLVFQNPESQLFADSVAADVAFGPRCLGASAEEALSAADDAMVAVGLDPVEFGSRSPFTLSGGEARRAAFAGVLAMRPRYLLADEPLSGLDARGRQGVRRLVLEARREAGIVVVSHSAEEFLDVADRVLMLHGGRAVSSATGSEVITAPELFGEAGLAPPDVLETQRLYALDGSVKGPYVLDPEDAARRLSAVGGRAS
jgi:energy-coupling factor transport system ATP-binding protein